MSVPSNLRYTVNHEWVALDGGIATVGITAHAADALGDVVYVDLPEVGTTVNAGSTCGEIESTKSVSDLFAPVSGEIVEINEAVVNDPSAVNLQPFEAGWLIRVRVAELPELISAEEYSQLIAHG